MRFATLHVDEGSLPPLLSNLGQGDEGQGNGGVPGQGSGNQGQGDQRQGTRGLPGQGQGNQANAT